MRTQSLYEALYCARGERENRIKEQMQRFADRTAAHHGWPNQFRLLRPTRYPHQRLFTQAARHLDSG